MSSLVTAGLATLAALMLAPPRSQETADEIPEGVSFGEGIPRHEQGQLRESFAATVAKACDPPPCIEDCPERANTVGLSITGDSRDYTLHWVATDPRLDAPLIIESSCELCSLVELEDQLATDISALCTRLDALDSGPGRLQVSTDPSGARLSVDGRPVGRTPWVGELPAGEHHLQVRANGHGSQQRTLQIVGGIEEHEHIELLARASEGRPRWPGWMSLGVGVALGLAGATLIALHDKDWPGRCSGSDIDVSGSCRHVYTTRPLGIALAGIGVGALVTGVGLTVWAQRDGPGRGSAGLSWQGRF